jgi:hydroxymethylpyrimidine pyrophosphatase-like HAD family hydrolase
MKAVFSDIDNVLMFDLEVASATRELIEAIRRQTRFVLVTARSANSVAQIPAIPHDDLIVENGCVVYEGETIDPQWAARIGTYLPLVEQYKRGLRLILRPKTSMVSIGVQDNHLSHRDIEALQASVPSGLVLRTSSNERGMFLEVYPEIAGKAAALQYVAGRLGVALEETCALGDDLVDIEMLTVCGFPVTHEQARLAVVGVVRERGGYVAPSGGHAGAARMLEKVLDWVG